MFDKPLVILDLETTGTGITRDRITEIGLLEVENGTVIAEWSSLVNPQAWISPFIETAESRGTSRVVGSSVAKRRFSTNTSEPESRLRSVDLPTFV